VAATVGAVVGASALGSKPTHHAGNPSSSGAAGQPSGEAAGQTGLLASAANAYQSDYRQFEGVFSAPNQAVGNASADITKQNERLQNDETTIDDGGGDASCDPSDFTSYESCLTQAEQTVSNAESDVNAATAAEHNDVAQEQTADGEIVTALSTFVQQLDGITWPSVAETDAANLTQALSDERDAYSQGAADLADDQDVTADNNAITTTGSAVTTQEINLATALQIPPPSS